VFGGGLGRACTCADGCLPDKRKEGISLCLI
jgi:hypothetical protein